MTSAVECATIDPAAALAAARTELRTGQPSLNTLAQLTQVTEILLAQVGLLADQLTEARLCPLTGLPTRALWLAQAEEVVTTGPSVVVMIDLNGFKPVNDRFGHAAGDAVLAEVGARAGEWARGRGCAGRLGGDEFVLAIREEPGLGQAITDLRRRLIAPIGYDSRRLMVGAALGVARVYGRTPRALSGALHRADLRMYRDKGQAGRR
ncbi:GGDEF domain-containing protein [Streptomyces sp. NPDC056672]|uniref:GGDEF domain-containing protein n=1 Tax=Streptomyces sp. NPDC056672 TaxID=3345906 RepID=UPI003678589E